MSLSSLESRDELGRASEVARTLLDALRAPAGGGAALAAAVFMDGRPVWSYHEGWEDLLRTRVVRRDSLFRVGSISKSLTSLGAVRLAQQGLLQMDRPIHECTTGLPRAWKGMTIRHLLCGASGIANYTGEEDRFDTTPYHCTRDALRRFRERPLAHRPGQAFTYSTYAYTVAALVMESVAGQPFEELMRSCLFEPCGTPGVQADHEPRCIPRRVEPLCLQDGRPIAAKRMNPIGRLAGCGFLASATDLARIGDAVLRPDLLDKAWRAELSSGTVLSDGTIAPWGLGWRRRWDWDGRPVLWSPGDMPGASAGLLVCPSGRTSIAMLSNVQGLLLGRPCAQAILRIFAPVGEGRALHPPHRLAGDYSVLDAEGARVIGRMRLRVVDRFEGAIELEAQGAARVACAFIDAGEGWVIAIHPELGVYPVRIRGGRGGVEARALLAKPSGLGPSLPEPVTRGCRRIAGCSR